MRPLRSSLSTAKGRCLNCFFYAIGALSASVSAMLRIIQSVSADAAKSYYNQGLSKEDYYSQGQEIVGLWGGKAAARLGLHGPVEKTAFDALCDNRNPETGGQLTARMNEVRTVGYDLNFHCPKSVSLVYALTQDDEILSAFRESVRETMEEIEAEMKTRVRRGGVEENRTTGNMAWAEFVHFTARPVEGVPDPHLHAHCFTFNATFDETEGQWKAGQFRDVKRDAPYFEAAFHARFAKRLADHGYPVERTAKGWEIAGIEKSVLDRFSRRTAQIEAVAEDKGIADPALKDGLGARTREGKRAGLGMEDLRTEWSSRLSPAERAVVIAAKQNVSAPPVSNRDAVKHSLSHAFERASVAPERSVARDALRFGVGGVSVEGVKTALGESDMLRREIDGRTFATTREVLREEKAMLNFARQGRASCKPLNPSPYVFSQSLLNEEQKAAVRHVLESTDRVIAIGGGAGVGKTTLMKEAVAGIAASGREVFTFAPSAEASRGVLRAEGFGNAETVARLLRDESLQEKLAGQVLWIDEAGLLGSKSMKAVFDLAGRVNARVVLSGDTRQHHAVERGDALRVLEDNGGVKPARVRAIQRQRGSYREAVSAFAKGDVEEGFAELERLGWVEEIASESAHRRLAEGYLSATADGKSVLVVSPTHKEADKVTSLIRDGLTGAGSLGAVGKELVVQRSLNWTEAERGDAVNYTPGLWVQFNQHVKGFRRGERAQIVGRSDDGRVLAETETGRTSPLPLDKAAKFGVYEAGKLTVATGETIRITQNGYTLPSDPKNPKSKHRLNNGALYSVAGFTKGGDIRLGNGWVVPKDYANLDYGYCSTSHASQGKTVDRVFIAQSAESFPASSAEQFYVSLSRGRESARIFTDDKTALKAAVAESGMRLSAIELAGGLREAHTPAKGLAQSFKSLMRDERSGGSGLPKTPAQYAVWVNRLRAKTRTLQGKTGRTRDDSRPGREGLLCPAIPAKGTASQRELEPER